MVSADLETRCDVLIAGGGLAGAALACALQHYAPRQRLWRIVVADNKKPIGAVPAECAQDPPTTALSLGSIRILQELGAWQHVLPHVAPMSAVEVRDQGGAGRGRLSKAGLTRSGVVLSSTELDTSASLASGERSLYIDGVPAIGAVVETPRLLAAICARLDKDKIEWLAPVSVDTPEADASGGHRVRIDSRRYTTGLLVAADGPRSALRAHLGLEVEQKAYGSDALLLNVCVRGVAPHRGYEIFLADGSLALLPIPSPDSERRALLVRVAPSAVIADLLAMDEKSLLSRLAQPLCLGDGDVYAPGAARSRALVMVWAREQYRRGVVLLGDAAHALHPIAAQGFNLTLRDANCLAQLLARAHARNTPLSDTALLARYVHARRYDQRAARWVSDGLPRIFARHDPWTGLARELAFATLRHVAPLRRTLLRRATGIM